MKADRALSDALEGRGIASIDIRSRIESIIAGNPEIAIPIDSVPEDLVEWSQTLNYQVSIWPIRKCVSDKNPGRVFYELPNEGSPEVSVSNGVVSRQGGGSFQDLLSSGKLQIGEQLYFDYREKIYSVIVRENGVEADGQVMSPSGASGYFARKATGQSVSTNGWDKWRNAAGKSLNELRNEIANVN